MAPSIILSEPGRWISPRWNCYERILGTAPRSPGTDRAPDYLANGSSREGCGEEGRRSAAHLPGEIWDQHRRASQPTWCVPWRAMGIWGDGEGDPHQATETLIAVGGRTQQQRGYVPQKQEKQGLVQTLLLREADGAVRFGTPSTEDDQSNASGRSGARHAGNILSPIIRRQHLEVREAAFQNLSRQPPEKGNNNPGLQHKAVGIIIYGECLERWKKLSQS